MVENQRRCTTTTRGDRRERQMRVGTCHIRESGVGSLVFGYPMYSFQLGLPTHREI